tara:strand:+ start:593 stop:1393 length:801 start_codon:yes stop_codon:yes gene_type:complete
MRYSHKIFLCLGFVIAATSAAADKVTSAVEQVADPAPSFLVSMPIMDDDPANGIEHPVVEFVRFWGDVTGANIEIERYPFKRSIKQAATGQVDFHFPLIIDRDALNKSTTIRDLGFEYSTQRVMTINFILYTRLDTPVDLNKLSEYRLATFIGHGNLFPFPIEEDHAIESSLMKLSSGRIDGYIFAESGGDPTLLELGLTGIKRQLYKVYDVHAVLPRGGRGQKADQFITEAVSLLATKELPLSWQYHEYVDWQVGDDVIPRIVQK